MAEKSTVWWASPDTDGGSPLQKLTKMIQRTGFLHNLAPGDDVAIKLHMSEVGNVRGLRPLWARSVADQVKQVAAQPFVTDTTTLYRHGRSTALGYLQTAAAHGFTAESMGCPVIIADGFHNSGTYIEGHTEHFQRVPVAQAIFDARAMVALAHCTFHPGFPLAGAIKNIGMGCTTKEAKIAMHQHESAPGYNAERCVGCWICIGLCPGGAFTKGEGAVVFEESKCVGCGDCIGHCRGGALQPKWDADNSKTQQWTCDAAKAALATFGAGKVLHAGIGMEITQVCDCGATGIPAVCDTGVFVSFDPVALDRAMWDKLHEVALYPGGALDRIANSDEAAQFDLAHDRATPLWRHVGTQRFWEEIVPQSGLGNAEYELETL